MTAFGPADPGPQAQAATDTGSVAHEPSIGTAAGADLPPAPAAPPVAPRPASSAAPPGSGGSFTDQPRTTFTAGNGLKGRYLLYAGGIDRTRPVGLVVYVDGTGEVGVGNPTPPHAPGGPARVVGPSKARHKITPAGGGPP